MKNLFLIVSALLCLAAAYTYFSRAERTERPEIVWTAGLSEDRIEQVAAFHEWLRANGYVDQDGELLFTVRLETTDNQSVLIQAVSGVAGDLIDHVQVKRFAPMGVLEDITQFAGENGLDPASGYGEAAGELLTWEGRQYAYYCNLVARGLLANLDTFAKYGMEPPPEEWTPEQFERIGAEFVKRANRDRGRREVFFAGAMPQVLLPLGRSFGADAFNETMTAATLNRPEFVRALRFYHRWVDELHLIPTAAELASESAQGSSANGEATVQLASGRYAMILTGRYANMDLRRFKTPPFRMAFCQPPEGAYKNLVLASRNTAIYKGSKHKEFAKIFLKFLADREYNDIIIRGSDGLPPNPRWAGNNPEYIAPPGYPQDGDLHANELKWARSIGIPVSVSPYEPLNEDKLKYAYEKFANGLATPEEALQQAEAQLNYSIRTTAESSARLEKEYKHGLELQKKIDMLKVAGKQIPAAWVTNPFYRKYYRDRNMLAD
jgi:ABC-type sugar transport system periplasmic component-like protein